MNEKNFNHKLVTGDDFSALHDFSECEICKTIGNTAL